MNDPLDEMIRAARSPVERPSDDDIAERTRARLMATARARSRKRIRLTTVLLPIAATFLATVAWAAATGRLPALPALFGGDTSVSTGGSSTRGPSRETSVLARSEVSPTPSASEVVRAESATPPSDTSTMVPSIAPTASALSDIDPAPSTHASASAPSASAVTSSSASAQEDPAEALYREAHALHFRGGSPALAVAAWDRYITAAPRGRFVSEAQYNRALALLRAGRKAEGLSALRPFATGAYGSYRRDEAKQILEAAERAGEK